MTHPDPPLAPATAALAALLLAMLLALAGCAGMASRAGAQLAGDLGAAMLDQDDPATVRDGVPAYLLLLDGMVHGAPDDAGLLLSASEMYAAYAGSFVQDAERARRLSTRALEYAWRGNCAAGTPVCDTRSIPFAQFEDAIARIGSRDLRAAYALTAAWGGWIRTHSEDWNALAEIPRVELLARRVVALEPEHDRGMPYVYLGVLNSLRPAAVGGDPEAGRAHFERAIALSRERNLTAKTLMAEHYARLVFDRELHDRLLRETLDADPRAPGFTLANTLAQQRAAELLAGSDAYFE
ncbi:MAG TPA: TRAP transporter TatT component family protein [Xanthomonadaceae bacterium]|nr:TRAP transporter TatT component family protein [Xanthomonadaceae bacterium]